LGTFLERKTIRRSSMRLKKLKSKSTQVKLFEDNTAQSKVHSIPSTRKKAYNDGILERQFWTTLKSKGITYEQLGIILGCSKANIARDLATRGLGKASLDRIRKMAQALDMELAIFLVPAHERKIKKKLIELMVKFGAGEGARTLDLKLGKLAL
jgi:transcriptional regulator with XRE-family HTH domain